MALTKFEYYDTSNDATNTVYAQFMVGQIFTVGTTGLNVGHYLNEVQIRIYRVGSPGTVTLELYATSASHLPTGDALATTTVDGDDFTADTGGEFETFVFTTPHQVLKSTEYALTIGALDGDGSNSIKIMKDETSPTYTGGSRINSTNTGSTWGTDSEADIMFRNYGTTPYTDTNSKYWGDLK